MIKLIIWDLDGVLWSESLAESGSIGTVNQSAIDFIKKTEYFGVIHSICSKNSFEDAKHQLELLGIWNLFVFPAIEFSAKGPLVKSIIENCQLRERDTLFVDDNPININEVKFFCPVINTELTTGFIDTFECVKGKSRTSQYNILERKALDKNNINFLKNSDINITFLKANHMMYYDRIVELVNRSNQLNFTQSRIDVSENESVLMPFAEFTTYNRLAVFAWDKYGYYGLVGFILSHDNKKTNTFVFSCRIMNMTIENYCSQYIKDVLGWEQEYHKPVSNDGDYSYITLHKYDDVESFIREHESLPTKTDNVICNVSAGGCMTDVFLSLSGISHLLSTHDYTTENLYNKLDNIDDDPKLAVFSVSSDIYHFSDKSLEYTETCVRNFIDTIIATDKKVLLIIPENLNQTIFNVTPDPKLEYIHSIWLSLVDDVHVYSVIVPSNNMDYTHWDRSTMYYIANKIKEWVLAHS